MKVPLARRPSAQRRTARALLAAWGHGPPDEEDPSPGLRAAAAAVVAEEEAVADARLSLDLHDLTAAAEPDGQVHAVALGQFEASEADHGEAEGREAADEYGDERGAAPDDEGGELEQRV